MAIHGFDVYRRYLAMKQHFSNPKFDYFQYEGKVRAKEETYQQRNDFWFFETLARKLNDQQVKEYLLATFIQSEDPSKVWIGDIRHEGRNNWLEWTRRKESLSYIFQEEIQNLITTPKAFNELFQTKTGHPPLLKMYIRKSICLETLVILDILLGFGVEWDRRLKDPLWSNLSFKIKKYKSFMAINRSAYKSILQKILKSSDL